MSFVSGAAAGTATFPSLFPKPPKIPPKFHPLRVSLQDSPPVAPPDSPSDSPPSKNSVWINPNSKNAARLHNLSAESRHSRLRHLASLLDSSANGNVTDVIPPSTSEQEAVILLNSLTNSSAAVAALRYFLSVATAPQNPTILYNVTLKIIRNNKDWQLFESILNQMLGNGVKPDNVTFSTIISCARLCNFPEKAVEWFEKMPEFDLTPDAVTYSVMIDAYGRTGNIETALGLYDRARKENWRLDPVTFATVIKVQSYAGNFDGALNVYQEMKALGIKPNVVAYNTLIDAMGRAGRPWQVKTIYREMLGKGNVPNRNTYATLIRAYGKARYAEDALSVYREVKEKGLEMNVMLYNTLLSMCADIGLLDEAIELFNEMKMGPENCKPDSWSYSSLITVYSCSGQVYEAENVLNEMVGAGYQPNIYVFTSLIQCYGKAKRIDDVVKSFNRLLEIGITPDDRFCGCLLNVMTQTPKEELGKIIGCIERSNVQLGSLVKLIVDEKSGNDAIKKDAEELLVNISSEVKKAYCNCLIDLSVNLNLLERACLLLDLALRLRIYTSLQEKSSTQWSLHVKSLSFGAALTALHVWMNDLSKVLAEGKELPPLLGINTGHGKHKYSEKGLASVFESHLRELNAPFYEAPDKVGWFLTTSVAAKTWLESGVHLS